MLADRSLPLAERLTRFYTRYLGRRTEAETRLFMRAALDRFGFPERYTPALDERVLGPIAREVCHELARRRDAGGHGDSGHLTPTPRAPAAALPAISAAALPVHERADAAGSLRRLDPIERERVMVLHGGLVFLNVRRHIYGTVLPADLEPLVRLHVTTFLDGAAAAGAACRLGDHRP